VKKWLKEVVVEVTMNWNQMKDKTIWLGSKRRRTRTEKISRCCCRVAHVTVQAHVIMQAPAIAVALEDEIVPQLLL
jgi:hypothetical protein